MNQNDNPFPPKGKVVDVRARAAWRKFGGFFGIGLIVLIALILSFSSAYELDSGKEAVVTLLGRHVRTESTPGLKFKLPLLEKAQIVDVSTVRRMEFGYREQNSGTYTDVTEEAQMLTGDENLVIADWTVQYRVADSYAYLFNVNDPETTLRVISESSYRRVVASHSLDDILTNQKDTIQQEVMEDLQALCDKYQFGVVVTGVQLQDAMPPDEVKDSFLEVTSAKEDKTAKINKAREYENEKLPIARGDAEKLLNDAEGYKQTRINEAEGATARYLAIAAEYLKAPRITRTRMYLEMVRGVFPKLKSIYILNDGGDTLKFLPLEGLTTGTSAAPAQETTGTVGGEAEIDE